MSLPERALSCIWLHGGGARAAIAVAPVRAGRQAFNISSPRAGQRGMARQTFVRSAGKGFAPEWLIWAPWVTVKPGRPRALTRRCVIVQANYNWPAVTLCDRELTEPVMATWIMLSTVYKTVYHAN